MGVFFGAKGGYFRLKSRENETKIVHLIRKISFSDKKIIAYSARGKGEDLESILRSSEELQDILRANLLVRKSKDIIFLSMATLADQLRVLDELKGFCAEKTHKQACEELQKKMKKLKVYVRKLQFIQDEKGTSWSAKIFPASNSKESFAAFVALCKYRLVESCEYSGFGTLENKTDHLLFVSRTMSREKLKQKIEVFYNLASEDKKNHQNYGSFYGIVPDKTVQTNGSSRVVNDFV